MELPSSRDDEPEDVCSMLLVLISDANTDAKYNNRMVVTSSQSMGGDAYGQGGCKREVREDSATLT